MVFKSTIAEHNITVDSKLPKSDKEDFANIWHFIQKLSN